MLSFTEVLNGLRLSLSEGQVAALDVYAEKVLEHNERAGLTASSTDRDAIYLRHFAESLALLVELEDRNLLDSPLIDIGTGAGFPGIPMKIARPELVLTLLEATGKKVDFLRGVVTDLGLTKVDVMQGRAEDLAHDTTYRGRYPVAVARALAPLRVLLELTLPFLQIGGVLAAPKGTAAPRELREAVHALEVLGGEIEHAAVMDVPGADGTEPTLIIVRKVSETPNSYPRRPGMPGKRPL